ncbi:MAG: transporter substrate-binding domain-containing protein [Methanoregula sp.]|nr:transporter substrate-binding domain-containing protein [Methanoregula sp.]
MDYRYLVFIAGLIVCFICCTGCVSETAAPANLTFYTEQYPPANFGENGTLKGVAVDLLVEMTGRMGTPVKPSAIHIVPWSEGYRETLGRNNVVLFSMARLPEREHLFKWAGPIMTGHKVLFARSGSGISVHGPADLAGYRIGVVTDDSATGELAALGIKADQLITDPDPAVVLQMLLDNKIDLFAYGKDAGEYLARNKTGGIPAIKVVYPLDEFELYYAFNNKTPDAVVEKYQQSLDALKKEIGPDGVSTYERIVGRYESPVAFLSLTYLTEEFPPLNYKEDGQLRGVSVDLLAAIFKNNGATLTNDTIEMVVWKDGYARAQNTTGTVLFSTARTPSREKLFKWAGPSATSENVLIADRARNLSIHDAADLDALVIGVMTDTSSLPALESLGVKKENLVIRHSATDLIQMLDNGSIDAWATGNMSGRHLISKHSSRSGSFVPVYTLASNNYYYAFNRDTPNTTVVAFQKALEDVKTNPGENGVTGYQRILNRYMDTG